MTTAAQASSQLDIAMMYARSGDTVIAHSLLRQIVRDEPANPHAWAWLAYVAADVEEKRAALYRAYRLTPQSSQRSRIHDALLRLMSPAHCARAAQNGVYISYVRADELFALDLSESLRSEGVNAWLDMTDIAPQEDWNAAIETALDTCGIMLLLLSPAALRTGELRSEKQEFLDTGKIVVPVLHEHCDVSGLNLPYSPIDFRHDFDLGVQQLLKILV